MKTIKNYTPIKIFPLLFASLAPPISFIAYAELTGMRNSSWYDVVLFVGFLVSSLNLIFVGLPLLYLFSKKKDLNICSVILIGGFSGAIGVPLAFLLSGAKVEFFSIDNLIFSVICSLFGAIAGLVYWFSYPKKYN